MRDTAGEGGYRAATLRRYARARARREEWNPLLAEAYRYALPHHDPCGTERPGSRRDKAVFDATAPLAVAWRRARLHGQLFPPFRQWMDFEPDVPGLADAGGSEVRRWLDAARAVFHAAIERSNFHIEIDGALGDALISTGAVLVHPGTPEDPLRFEAAPIARLVVEEGPDGMIRTLFRRWKLPGRDIAVKWPDASLPDSLRAAITREENAEVELVEAMLHDYRLDRCDYEVWALTDGEHRIVARQYRTGPGIAFRADKAPGEWMGRGPVISVLGDIKTANKVVELTLRNAGGAISGMWQADDDGVIDFTRLKLQPGVVIRKAAGSAGLQPLQPAARFDVAQLVLRDLQENIRRGIVGPALPPGDDRVRTATEIDARQMEHQAVELPMSLRLLSELYFPLARRVLAILSSPEMAGSPYAMPPLEIDGRPVRPKPASPLVRLQQQADAVRAAQVYAGAATLFPDLIGGVVDRTAFLRDHLLEAGLAPEHLLSEDAAAAQAARRQSQQEGLQGAEELPAPGAPPA